MKKIVVEKQKGGSFINPMWGLVVWVLGPTQPQVMVLYTLANFVAWLWRDKTIHLTTFRGGGSEHIAACHTVPNRTTSYHVV